MNRTNGKVLRTLLVGLGRIGWQEHLPALLETPGFRVTAAVDPAPERLAECENAFGIAGYPSLETALARERFDLAVIASPTCFHAEQTVAALRGGCRVFCDKPAALDEAEFRRMASAAASTGRLLTVYQPLRVSRHQLYLKELLRSGKLGAIFQLKLYRESWSCRDDWQALRKNGGGMLLNYGSHLIDQANDLLGGGGEVLGCTADRILSRGDADDVVKLLLRYGTVTVDIDIDQAAADRFCRIAVYGDRGSAVLPAAGDRWRLRLLKRSAAETAELHPGFAAPGRQYPAAETEFEEETVTPPATPPPVRLYYENLYRAVTAGEALIDPLAETGTLVRMIDAARACARGNAARNEA